MNHLIQIATAEEEGGGGSNFLVPNMTFVFEFISFLIIMWVLYKYVIPPINQAMTERQEKIKAQFDEAAQLKADAQATEQEHQAQLADARAEASRIREEAREQGAQIIAQHREQAKVEADRVTEAAHAQIEAERSQALAQLKEEVDGISTQLAGRIIGEPVEDANGKKGSVSRS